MPHITRFLPLLLIAWFFRPASAADLDANGSVPAIAADGDLVALVLADKSALSCAISHDGGNTFSSPAPVGTVEPGQMLGMRRGPQIAIRKNTLLIVTNNGKGNRILAFRSGGGLGAGDAGKSWHGPTPIDNPAGCSPEGLLSIAPTRDGFAIAFLELVDKSMRISLLRSTDDGSSWRDSQLLYRSPDGHVCECCQPTIASDRAGNLAVMFRNWLGGNRDMYLLTSPDDGKTFTPAQKLGQGSWRLNACPMDGGGLTFDAQPQPKNKELLTVFRRENTLFTARPGQPESRLADGKNAVIAATPDGPVLAWETQKGLTVLIPNSPDLLIPSAAAPVLCTTSRGILLAYTQNGPTTQTHTRLVWQPKPR